MDQIELVYSLGVSADDKFRNWDNLNGFSEDYNSGVIGGLFLLSCS